jgi:hypothetical protein
MVEQALVPWLRKRLGLREEGCAITLRFVGIGQSAIDATLREQVPLPPRMVVTSRFEGTRVDFTFSLPEAGPQSEQQLMTLTEEVRRHLGSHLYATNTVTLEEVVLARLKARGASWVVAESSGPHLAAALSRAAFRKEAGPPLVDSLAATSESDLRRLVSLDDVSWTALTGPDVRAAALARAARRLAGSAWALAIGEPVAVQGDRRVVWVALAGPGERAEIWSVGLRDSPETGWPNLVSEVLDHLRRLE